VRYVIQTIHHRGTSEIEFRKTIFESIPWDGRSRDRKESCSIFIKSFLALPVCMASFPTLPAPFAETPFYERSSKKLRSRFTVSPKAVCTRFDICIWLS